MRLINPKITRPIFIAALCLLVHSSYAQNNFAIISYGTNTYYPREIFFGDSNEIYHVGQCNIRGTINNEVSWNGYCYTPNYIMGGCSPSLANTFVVGKAGLIWKNSDCEIFGSWSNQSSGTSDTLYSIKFFDIQTGVIVGQNGRILRTENNGRQWTPVASGTTVSLRNLQIISDSSMVICGGNGTILRSNDRGLTWNTQTSGVITMLNDIDFIGDTGYVVGRLGVMLKTIDGGLTWNTLTTGTTSNIAAVDFVSGQVGMIAGDAGVVKRTTDGGQSWVSLPFSTYYPMWDIKFKNKNEGYLLSTFDAYKTSDGGLSWHTMGGTLEAVRYINDTTLIAVGDDNVSKSTNGGLTWKISRPLSPTHWYDCVFPTPDTGYICGNGGRIMKTIDGGNSYTQQVSNAPSGSNYFFGMHFFNKNKGIAVGSDYMIARTNNGGLTWTTTASSSSNTYSYYDVFFINNQIGWICGSMGTLRKSLDGGATFNNQTSGVTKYLLSIYFLTPLKGFACGESGTLLKTLDGGTTWTNSQLVSSSSLYHIAFMDSLHGFISGDSQLLFETKDGGTTWKYINNNFSIKAMEFRNSYYGYAVGPYENRLYYDPMKVFNGYTRVCKGSSNSFVPKLVPGISIQPGNHFIMEMDTSGNDFTDALTLGAYPDTASSTYWNFTIPKTLKAGIYKTRVRATNMSPVHKSLTTNMTVYDDPEAKLSVRNDTLFTLYNPNYNYQWFLGYTEIVGANAYFYVPAVGGKYTVKVQYGCCTYATDILTIKFCPGGFLAQPQISNSYAVICDSSSTTLSASGAAHYRWYDSDTSTVVLSSTSSYTTPVLTARDTFYVAAYNDSCESGRVPIYIQFTSPYPAPTVVGDSACIGSDVFLISNYGSYSYWYADSSSTALLQMAKNFFIPNLQATDTFWVSTLNYQCESKRTPVIAYAFGIPTTGNIIGDTTVTIGDTAAYYYAAAPGDSIKWFVHGGMILSNADSLLVKWSDSTTVGAVGIIETNTTGCSTDTLWQEIAVDLAISIQETKKVKLHISPNPANNRLFLEREDDNATEYYFIYQSEGKLVQKFQFQVGKRQVVLDTSKYTNGTYFLRSQDANQVEVKFVIQHE